MTYLASALVGLALVAGSGAPAQAACKNFIGGVCLDKKQKKTQRKKTTRKKSTTTRKKATAPQRAQVKHARAGDCMQIQKINKGKSGNLSAVKLTNGCDAVVHAFINFNTCSVSLGILGAKFKRQQLNAAVAVKGRDSKTVAYKVAEDGQKQDTAVLTRYFYSDAAPSLKDKSKYPKSKC